MPRDEWEIESTHKLFVKDPNSIRTLVFDINSDERYFWESLEAPSRDFFIRLLWNAADTVDP